VSESASLKQSSRTWQVFSRGGGTVPDSPLNVYLRALKLVIADAEREMDEQEFSTLCSILILHLAGKHQETA
jgi:hypothetical protein